MTRTKALVIVIVFLLLSAGFADVKVFVLSNDISANQQSDTHALCAFRADLQRRVNSGTTFLISHPHGIPGIPVGIIRVSLLNQQETLVALHTLKC